MKEVVRDMSQAMEMLCASTEQCRIEMDGGIYDRLEDVPDAYQSIFLERDSNGTRNYDYAGLLQHGKDWIIEPLRELQPHSFQAFQEVVGPLFLGIMLIADLVRPERPPIVRPIMFFDASGRMVEVHPTFPGNTYEEGEKAVPDSLQSLPDALAKSWLWRTRGWRMPSEPFQGPLINRRLVCHPMQGWSSVSDVLKTYDPKRWKWMMNSILGHFPDAVVTRYNPHDGNPYQWTSMRCFLDTRPSGLNGPMGDQFFVFDQKRDRTVYHIHQGDIDDIRILHDPADAIDRYCAHVLRRIPGEFDFSKWSEPLPA